MNSDNRKFGALSSSVNPQELATTVQGIIKAIGGAVAFFGLTTITGDVNSIAEQVGTLITLGYSFLGVAETIFGLVRKVVVAVSQKF